MKNEDVVMNEPIDEGEGHVVAAAAVPAASRRKLGEILRDFLIEVWAGATTTTMFSWVAVLAVAVVEFSGWCAFFTPRRLITIDPLYVMENSGDDYVRLSITLLQFRLSEPSELQVVLCGGSGVTRSLNDRNPELLSKFLSKRVGRRVTFNLFSTNNQRYEDALEIADQLPKSYRGIFVLGVNPWRADYKKPENEAALRWRIAALNSPTLEGIWREKGFRLRRTGIFFIDHLDFFAARRSAAMRFGKAAGEFYPDPMKDDKRIEKEREALAKRVSQRTRPGVLNSSRHVVSELIRVLQEREIPVVLMEGPMNPLRYEITGDSVNTYQKEIVRFAAFRGATYIDLNPGMNFAPEDFQDNTHLGTRDGRKRFQSKLLDKLAEIITEQFPDDDGDEDEAT